MLVVNLVFSPLLFLMTGKALVLSGALAGAAFFAGLWYNRRLLVDLQKHYDEEVTQNLHKTRFIRNAYHEVRNQLWGVFSITRLLAKAKDQDTLHEVTDLDDIIGTLGNGCRNLETILSNILDYSQYEAGVVPRPLYEAVNVRSLLENLVESVRFTAAERNVQVKMHYPAHVPEYLVADPVKIIQIVTNLTNNAIKFTRQHSCVEVFVNADWDNWAVSIKDEGHGIPNDKMKIIFDPFAIERNLANAKGVGLGLHISHLLTKTLGGRIDVQSIPGQGSVFTVCLPIPERQLPLTVIKPIALNKKAPPGWAEGPSPEGPTSNKKAPPSAGPVFHFSL